MIMQSAIAISLNLGCDSVEVDHIVINMMGVLHAEMIELMLGIGNRIVGTQNGLEFYDKFIPAVHPQGMSMSIIHS